MAQTQAVCTIIAKNYLASARTLCESLLALHKDTDCYVLVVDEFEGYINPAEERFEVVKLSDLDIPNPRAFCFKYDVTELSTAAKPYLLEYLIAEKSIDKLLYIDPDVLITNRLDPLFERLNAYDIVLTPHLDTDYPDDNLRPNDQSIMKSGVFNLGFIGIRASETTRDFLEWWQSKVYTKCVIDRASGYFVDQKFIDLVPSLFDNFFVEKDVGYNVAYWNLHSRTISKDDEGWKCNGRPLRFFHFSGYRPERPEMIASHMTRYRMSDRPDLHPLFSVYTDRLNQNGYHKSRPWRYTFNYFDDGRAIPREVRIAYRNSEEWQKCADPFQSPALKRLAWLTEKRQTNSVVDSIVRRLYERFSFSRRLIDYWIRSAAAD